MPHQVITKDATNIVNSGLTVIALGLVHTVRFFLITTAIPHIATNGLYRTQ